MKRYNHTVNVTFTVHSDDPVKPTYLEIYLALVDAMRHRHGELIDTAESYDVNENDRQAKGNNAG